METLEVNIRETIHSYCYVSYHDMRNVSSVIIDNLKKNPNIKKIILNFSEIEYCYASYIDDLIGSIYKKIDNKIDQFEMKNLQIEAEDLPEGLKNYDIQKRNEEIYNNEQEYKKYQAEWEAKYKNKTN